ncbi:polysaccharide lyase 6 family protein [Adhaeretor mobilis]|uniref:Chondroitinase-B n=1 Tax=Adhaeretor mobilis TaxID=1930276 RepID=A0A517MSZ2_9BACT|nr:polysaccharide lyase 6 family protein [Adhaeretor mobilis]QDS97962.1 Chondroitinase-B precursor [Adhaeretor mobilis]
MKMRQPILCAEIAALVVLLAFASPSSAADFIVSNADDIETAMETAVAGDTLIMTNGNWTNQNIAFAGNGISGMPITLRADTPGGVILNGSSQLQISGSHLVVDGLHFKGGTLENSDHVVQFRGPLGEATNSRFTNSVIESYYNPNDLTDKWHYISLYGEQNRVDHNRFLDQRNSGPQIVAWLDESNPLSEARHTIDANHFADRPQGWENGFEAIRLGESEFSHYDSHILVENNLFERVDGEIEIISSKANDNIFRYNTFRESKGTLTLRHGHRAVVEGNFFLGEGTAESGGIRVVGEDHVIVNNYIADVDDAADGAISLASGTTGSNPSGYQPVDNVLIAHNTIVNVGGAGVTLDWGHGSSGRSVLPQGVTVARNLISSTASPLFEGTEGPGYTWADNIAFGAPLGIAPRPGIDVVDPQLVQGPDGLWRPSAGSPAIDAVAADYVTDDFEGQPRIGLFDIGADENSMAQIVRKPLTNSDVGALWFNYEEPDVWPLPVQLPPGDFLVIEAEDFTGITDPDSDGKIWTVADVDGASSGQVLTAPTEDGTPTPAAHETLALYDIVFSEEGDYTVYYLARGFDGSSNSIYTPDDFGVDPDVAEHLSENGAFRWESGDEFSISSSHVGMPLEFRLGSREDGSEIDAIIFHQNGGLTENQLDSILASTSVPEPTSATLVLITGMSILIRRRRRTL